MREQRERRASSAAAEIDNAQSPFRFFYFFFSSFFYRYARQAASITGSTVVLTWASGVRYSVLCVDEIQEGWKEAAQLQRIESLQGVRVCVVSCGPAVVEIGY